MKAYLCILLSLFFLLSCGDNQKKGSNNFTANSVLKPTSKKELINPILEKGIKELLASKEHAKYPDIPIEESCIILRSQINRKDSIIYFSDSTVTITYNIYEYSNMNCYKGIIDIAGYNVAVFDFGNFLDNYYNSDSLRQIPFDKFKKYPMNVILLHTYYIKNNELRYWNP